MTFEELVEKLLDGPGLSEAQCEALFNFARNERIAYDRAISLLLRADATDGTFYLPKRDD